MKLQLLDLLCSSCEIFKAQEGRKINILLTMAINRRATTNLLRGGRLKFKAKFFCLKNVSIVQLQKQTSATQVYRRQGSGGTALSRRRPLGSGREAISVTFREKFAIAILTSFGSNFARFWSHERTKSLKFESQLKN